VTHLRFAGLLMLLGASVLLPVRLSVSGSGVRDKNTKPPSPNSPRGKYFLEFMGMHTLSPTRHWPDLAFGSIRPAGVSWGALEPSRGQYDWHSLDTWVEQAQRHHVQLDYVFVNVPLWASSRPNEPCIGKKLGCAAPPKLEDWDEFVTSLATRYKGKISSYELWNEPNASGFWTGTPKQMAELAAHAYPIIKSVDPAAIVATPATSSTGYPLSHDAWLDQYFAAGGGKYADVVAWHGYAGRNDRPALPPEGLAEQIRMLRGVLDRHHLSQLPIWNTEGGWGKDAQLPDEQDEASFLVKWYMINFTYGVARAYWYQWDNADWGTLWREKTGITPAGKAAQQVEGWLDGATSSTPCMRNSSSRLWMCDLQKGNALYRVVWSDSGETEYRDDLSMVLSITAEGGQKQPFNQNSLRVGYMPALLEVSAKK
jgi:hypothetical protein